MKSFLARYRHAWILCYGFIYLPWFLYLEKTVTRNYHIIHTRIDDLIPFSEYFIIPYYLWFFYVGGAILYFFFKNPQEYYRMCTFLFTGMTLSLFICTIYHNGTDLRPVVDPDKNIFTWMVALLHKADTSTNIFPSVHVFNSIGVHIAVAKSSCFRNRPWVVRLSLLIAVSICISTVVLKQHSVIDGLGAMVMSYALYPLVYGEGYASSRRKVAGKALS
ncbi:MAG: phosphatase PAP2 family protein [Hungatella sp.]|nr:phosphatase PAP2 family protein [Hungatella sp.]